MANERTRPSHEERSSVTVARLFQIALWMGYLFRAHPWTHTDKIFITTKNKKKLRRNNNNIEDCLRLRYGGWQKGW